MKHFSILLLVLLVSINSCNQSEKSKSQESKFLNSDKIEVLYFHFERRCITCNAVENITKEIIANHYSDKVNFTSVNLDEPDGKKIGESLMINMQALVILFKDSKIDLTKEAFMYAKNSPEKLEEIIKEKLDALL